MFLKCISIIILIVGMVVATIIFSQAISRDGENSFIAEPEIFIGKTIFFDDQNGSYSYPIVEVSFQKEARHLDGYLYVFPGLRFKDREILYIHCQFSKKGEMWEIVVNHAGREIALNIDVAIIQ
jgi:hypothetical protein